MFDMKQQRLTWQLALSLAFILIGMALVIEQEIKIQTSGLIWTFFAVISTSAAQMFFFPLKKSLGLDSIQLLFHTAPWLTVGSFFMIPLFEKTNLLIEYDMKYMAFFMILSSCVLAVAFNLSNYLVLSSVSPLTYSILNQVKTVIIVITGSYIFQTIPSQRMIYGILWALAGVCIYTYEIRRQSETQSINNLYSNSSGVSSFPSMNFGYSSKSDEENNMKIPTIQASNIMNQVEEIKQKYGININSLETKL
eukprot:gene11912-15939_t